MFIHKKEVGIIRTSSDNVIFATGLGSAFIGEILNIHSPLDTSSQAIIMSIEGADIFKLLLIRKDRTTYIIPGDRLFRTRQSLTIRCGWHILGRIVNAFGDVIYSMDLNYHLYSSARVCFEENIHAFLAAPGICERAPVSRAYLTGVNIIDTFFPIGCGQRQLILGDHNTGKTTLAITIIINQGRMSGIYNQIWRDAEIDLKSNNDRTATLTPCVYISIGKRRSEILRIRKTLETNEALSYTTIVFTASDDLAATQYYSAYTGTALTEWFRKTGYHCTIVYDDLTTHAVAYRQVALLLRRPPGREAFPGDIFFVHSKLLERAGQVTKSIGGGSITAFPIVETQSSDLSGFIPTNVISITDGQIFLSSLLHHKGILPAIEFGLSVSRVGSNAQFGALKVLSKLALRDYAAYKVYEGVISVSVELDPSVDIVVTRGLHLLKYFKQGSYKTTSVYTQVISLFAICNGYLTNVEVKNFEFYFEILFNSELAREYLGENGTLHALHASHFSEDFFECLIVEYESDIVFDFLHNFFSVYHPYFVEVVQPKYVETENVDADTCNEVIKEALWQDISFINEN